MALWTIKRIPKVPVEGDVVEAVTFDDATDGDVVEAQAKLREEHPDHNIFVDHFKPTRPDEAIPGTVTPQGSVDERRVEISKAQGTNINTPAKVGAAGIGDNVATSTVDTVDGTKIVSHDGAGPDADFQDKGHVDPADGKAKPADVETGEAKIDNTGATEPAPAAAV